MLFPDAISELRDSYDSESRGKSPQSENPDTTWQTRPPFLESKSLLEQNCCRLAHPIKAVSLIRSHKRCSSHSRRFFHEFPIHRSGQAGYFAQPGGPIELGAVADAAGARSAAADADYQRFLRRGLS